MEIQFSQMDLIKKSIMIGLSIMVGLSLLLGLSISLSGCASQEEKKPVSSDKVKKWQTLADKSISINPVPPANDNKDESVLEDMAEPVETEISKSHDMKR
jgi:hypothetical protein